MLSKSLNNRDICETHVDYRLALIHSTCNSNRQSELKVTHKSAPNAPPRFKNVIFQTHYVRQKNSRFIEKKTAVLLKKKTPKFNVGKSTKRSGYRLWH